MQISARRMVAGDTCATPANIAARIPDADAIVIRNAQLDRQAIEQLGMLWQLALAPKIVEDRGDAIAKHQIPEAIRKYASSQQA